MTDVEFALLMNPPPRRASLRLTPETLARIRSLSEQGVTNKQLADRFGLDRSTISNVIHKTGAYAQK